MSESRTPQPAVGDAAPPDRVSNFEIVIAVVLALAALASTWCGYQASRWDRAETHHRDEADVAERGAGEQTIIAEQVRTFEGMQVLEYWSFLREKDSASAAALRARMRPALRDAIEGAIEDGVLEDPSVPGPLQREDYLIDAAAESERLRDEAAHANELARAAGDASSNYVLLALLFGMVLFFGGITGTFSARRIRLALGAVAIALFLATFAMLAGLPVFLGS